MKHIISERLRLSVPDVENLEGYKFVFEINLKSAGRDPSDTDRASALTNYGYIKHRYIPLAICLRESGELIGIVKLTMNLDAFTVVEVGGKASVKREKPLEIGIRLYIHHRHRRHGYGFEAARIFINYVRSVLSAHRVVSESSGSELQAIRLMKRLGMTIQPCARPDRPERIIGLLQS